jgi:hypothetical protein
LNRTVLTALPRQGWNPANYFPRENSEGLSFRRSKRTIRRRLGWP